MARTARTTKPASAQGPTTRRLRSQSKNASPLQAYSPPKRATRAKKSQKSTQAAPSEPSPPTTAESENNTEAENTETEAESVEAEAETQITTAQNHTQVTASQLEEPQSEEQHSEEQQSEAESQSEAEVPSSKEQLYSSSSNNASAETGLPSSEAGAATLRTMEITGVQTMASISPKHPQVTAARSMESIAVQTTPGLVRGLAPAYVSTQTSPLRPRDFQLSGLHHFDYTPLNPDNSPAQQERNLNPRKPYCPSTQLYKLTKADLIEIIRIERQQRHADRVMFANHRTDVTRLQQENDALKLTLRKKRAYPSDDEEDDEAAPPERPAVRRRLNPGIQTSSEKKRASLPRRSAHRPDPYIRRLLFGNTFPLPRETSSDEEEVPAQRTNADDAPKSVDPHLFPDTGSTKYIIGNAERFEKKGDDNKENDAEAGALTASQTSSGSPTQSLTQSPPQSPAQSPTEQLSETSATNRWGVRSLFGSVSRYIPGFRGAAQTHNHTIHNNSQSTSQASSEQRSEQTQQARSDDHSVKSDAQSGKDQPSAANTGEINQTTPSARERPQPQMPRTEPHNRQSQPTSNTPATDGRRTARHQRRNADARYAAMKAKEQEREDIKARSEQKAREAEEAKQRKEAAEKEQHVGQKRKRVRIDDLKVIPAGPPGTYGMLDKYFEQGSDSEDDYVEVDESFIIEHEEVRPAKRVRIEEPKSDKESSPSQLSPIVKTPTPGPRQIAGPARRAHMYRGSMFAESSDKRTYEGGNAFSQHTGAAAASPARPALQFSTPRPAATSRPSDTPSTIKFNQSGHFAVPESDSESDSEKEQAQVQVDQSGSTKSQSEVQKNKTSAISSAADDFLAILKRDQAKKQLEKDQEREEALKQSSTTPQSSATPNVFATSAQKKPERSIPGLGNATPITSSPFGTTSTSILAPPSFPAPSPSPQKPVAANAPAWEQPMPPRPVPSHASLPANTPLITAPITAPPANVDSEALARARSAAEKYKPKVPSRLQASSRLSNTSTAGSDVGDDNSDGGYVAPHDTSSSIDKGVDGGKTGEYLQPAHGLNSEAASFMKPAPVKDIEAATGSTVTGPAPAQAVEAGQNTTPFAPFTSGISLPDLVPDDAEVRALIAAIPDELLANMDFGFAFPQPEEFEMDDEVRQAIEENCQGGEWERWAAEDFERGFKEYLEQKEREGKVVNGIVVDEPVGVIETNEKIAEVVESVGGVEQGVAA